MAAKLVDPSTLKPTNLKSATAPSSRKELPKRVDAVVADGALGFWHKIPNGDGWGGDGAKGRYLEMFVNVNPTNKNFADAHDIEIKTHGGTSTLVKFFHLSCLPGPPRQGRSKPTAVDALAPIVEAYGHTDDEGRRSFSATIRNTFSDLAQVVFKDELLVLEFANGQTLTWVEKDVFATFVKKLRNTIYVSCEQVMGTDGHRYVRYYEAQFLRDLCDLSTFKSLMLDGTIRICFDVRSKRGGRPDTLRDHGTAWRVPVSALAKVWGDAKKVA